MVVAAGKAVESGRRGEIEDAVAADRASDQAVMAGGVAATENHEVDDAAEAESDLKIEDGGRGESVQTWKAVVAIPSRGGPRSLFAFRIDHAHVNALLFVFLFAFVFGKVNVEHESLSTVHVHVRGHPECPSQMFHCYAS